MLLRVRIADEYLKEEKFDDALRLANEVIALNSDNPTAFLVLGEALVAKGDPDGGIAALETSRKFRPETARTHWDLLRAYTTSGRAKDAKQEKEEIEQLLHPVTPE